MDRLLWGSERKSAAGPGRPLGSLIAWLQCGAEHQTKESHHAAKREIGRSEDGFASRFQAREWAKTQDNFQPLFAAERAPRPGEGDEPEIGP
eukprot:16436074-Heterocapsa_arctica.AAC.1